MRQHLETTLRPSVPATQTLATPWGTVRARPVVTYTRVRNRDLREHLTLELRRCRVADASSLAKRAADAACFTGDDRHTDVVMEQRQRLVRYRTRVATTDGGAAATRPPWSLETIRRQLTAWRGGGAEAMTDTDDNDDDDDDNGSNDADADTHEAVQLLGVVDAMARHVQSVNVQLRRRMSDVNTQVAAWLRSLDALRFDLSDGSLRLVTTQPTSAGGRRRRAADASLEQATMRVSTFLFREQQPDDVVAHVAGSIRRLSSKRVRTTSGGGVLSRLSLEE
jgi:hypothetical protein